jgi:hypothetical protein
VTNSLAKLLKPFIGQDPVFGIGPTSLFHVRMNILQVLLSHLGGPLLLTLGMCKPFTNSANCPPAGTFAARQLAFLPFD